MYKSLSILSDEMLRVHLQFMCAVVNQQSSNNRSDTFLVEMVYFVLEPTWAKDKHKHKTQWGQSEMGGVVEVLGPA